MQAVPTLNGAYLYKLHNLIIVIQSLVHGYCEPFEHVQCFMYQALLALHLVKLGSGDAHFILQLDLYNCIYLYMILYTGIATTK